MPELLATAGLFRPFVSVVPLIVPETLTADAPARTLAVKLWAWTGLKYPAPRVAIVVPFVVVPPWMWPTISATPFCWIRTCAGMYPETFDQPFSSVRDCHEP